ncbi:sugar ABC transporter substrate-binding protein [Deinococcus roseus]|uniref:Maltose ABC transporter substrate-binding protein n=1 Tax=Deinococcus roseus TaxID=392414 RepID=A0ABQ2CWL4_9DEIO|nr:maltose ABC transporter substrate-binding protein [Deinococcus roseus]GGJ28086.1 maltose ABC transporter substrate-binding protein [Deinococcus roseus]
MKRTVFSITALLCLSAAQAEKLTLWTGLDGKELEWLTQTAKDFSKTREGAGVTVDVVVVPYNEIDNKLKQSAPTGTGPDLLGLLPHDRVGALATAGVLEPVSQYLDAKTRSDLPPSAMDAMSYNGKLFGFPAFGEAVAIVYNKKLLPGGIPKTWSSFISTAQKLTNPQAQQFGFLTNISLPYTVYGFYSSMGAYVFGKKADGSLNPSDIGLGNAGAVKGAQLLADMRFKQNLIPAGAEASDVQKDLFTKGKLAMWLTGPWDIGDVKKAGIDYGVGVPPKPTGAKGKFSPFVGIQGVLMNAYGKNKARAAQLALYLTNAQNQSDMNTIGGRIPVSKSAVRKLKNDPVVAGFGAAIAAGTPMPNIPEMGAVWSPWGNAITLSVKTANADISGLLGKAVGQMAAK